MDFGLQGKWALVCAASKGLGKGCAQALVSEGRAVYAEQGAQDDGAQPTAQTPDSPPPTERQPEAAPAKRKGRSA